MKNQYRFQIIAVLILSFLTLAALSAPAKSDSSIKASLKADEHKAAIIETLAQKLRADLTDENVFVKINSLKDYEISGKQISFEGAAVAIVKTDNAELPLEFKAKLNLVNQGVEDLSYKFVESVPADFAAAVAEDNMKQELMARIGEDFQTTNIVLSIDGFDRTQISSNQTKYQGNGEVRIGDFEWSKIKFEVVIDSQYNTATKILYDIQK
jgi:hypothetical protein